MALHKKLRIAIQLVVFALLGTGVVWYMFSQMSAEQRGQMADAVAQINPVWVLPFIVTTLLSHWSRAKRWQLLLHPLGIYPSTANTLFSVLIGYLVNLVPPRAGEVAKCTVLARYEKVPADKMIGTIVAERAWDVVCLVAIIAGGLIWQASVMDDHARENLMHYMPKGKSLLITGLAIAALVGLLFFLYKRRPAGKLSRLIKGLATGVSSIWKIKKRGLFMLYTFMIWAGFVAQILIGFWALPGTQHLGVGAAVMTLIFGSVGMIAAPGGIGLYPFLTALILASGYGISGADANAFGWVSWTGLTALILVMGIVSLLLLPVYNKKKHDKQATVD